MKKLLITITDEAHEKLVAYKKKYGFSNLDSTLENIIDKMVAIAKKERVP